MSETADKLLDNDANARIGIKKSCAVVRSRYASAKFEEGVVALSISFRSRKERDDEETAKNLVLPLQRREKLRSNDALQWRRNQRPKIETRYITGTLSGREKCLRFLCGTFPNIKIVLLAGKERKTAR